MANDKVNNFFISKEYRETAKKDITMIRLNNYRKRTISMSDDEVVLPRKLMHKKKGIIIQSIDHEANIIINPSSKIYLEGERNSITEKNSTTFVDKTLTGKRALIMPLFITAPGNHNKSKFLKQQSLVKPPKLSLQERHQCKPNNKVCSKSLESAKLVHNVHLPAAHDRRNYKDAEK